MRVALDISPLQTGHKVRGVGFYVRQLRHALQKYFPENDYIFFTDSKEIPDDVDIIHYPYFDLFSRTLPKKTKHKTVITVHDVTPLVFPEHFPAGIRGKLTWLSQRQKLKAMDWIITQSQNSKKDIMKYTDISEEKISVVYLAAGEEFKPSNNELKKKKVLRKYHLPEKFVLYVGDVTWNKNIPRLLHTFNNTDIPLVMVGKALTQEHVDQSNVWNKDLIEAQRLIAANKHIYVPGFVESDDLVTLINLATVFVFPSIYEGFGLPILEAMQCGIPVITTRESSIPEVAGDAAYYVDGYNGQSILDGITTLMHNEKLRKKFSQAGIKQSSRFSWRKTAKETIEVYKQVIGDSL